MPEPTSPPPAFGRALALRPVPLCPELRLWLLDGDVDLESECRELGDAPPPYWAFAWGAGQALARYLLDHPHEVRGARVADLGAGSGVVAIAAARAGARRVTAVDLDAGARQAVRANAHANGVGVEVAAAPPEDCDLVLAADVQYEPGPREWLRARWSAGGPVLVAEPDRPGASAPALDPLLRVEARTFPDVDSPVRTAAIYRAGGAGARCPRG